MIDTYTIKTYTRQAYRNYGDASRVIEVVFRWILMRLNKSKSSVIRPEAIIAAMKRKSESPIRYEFEPSKLEHQIHIGSCTFLLRKDMSGCRIMIGVSSKRGFYLTYQNPEEIAKVLIAYPDYIPVIERELYYLIFEGQKKSLLCNLNKTIACGIIGELERADEIRMPPSFRVIGKAQDRVSIHYSDTMMFSCPLTHLRATLKRKFPFTPKNRNDESQ